MTKPVDPESLPPVEFTSQEREVLRSLARQMGQPTQEFSAELVEDEGWEERMRRVAREEIASLAGLVTRRTQEFNPTRSPDHNLAVEVVNDRLAQIFGEALADFSGSTTGEEPGA